MKRKLVYRGIGVIIIFAVILITIVIIAECNKRPDRAEQGEANAYLLLKDGIITQISDDDREITVIDCEDNSTYTLDFTGDSNLIHIKKVKIGDKITFGYFPYNQHDDWIKIYDIEKK